ncbi:response regulator (plasmid) [Nitrobacteraceae bacterium UC4446_H13]
MENAVVLVVEDEPLLRLDVVDFLRDSGMEVREAANADHAIGVLEEGHPIHLVFTDIFMPGSMDGLRRARVVAERWPPTRIIVTSGFRTVEITDIPDGSVFFSKPYRPEDVIDLMQELLAGRAGRQAPRN